MKVSNIVSLCIIALCSNLYADSYLHVTGGLNFSSMSYADSTPESSDMRTGINCGIRFEQNFAKHFSFLTGFSFETRGQTQTKTLESPTVIQEIEEEIHLFYLQVPFIAQFNLPIGSRLNINAFAGPDIGASLAAEKNIEKKITPDGGDVVMEHDTVNLAENMSMLDFGLLCGIGCEVKLGQVAVYVRPEYYLGLIDFIKKKKAGGGDESINVGKHRNFGFSTGLKIALNKD